MKCKVQHPVDLRDSLTAALESCQKVSPELFDPMFHQCYWLMTNFVMEVMNLVCLVLVLRFDRCAVGDLERLRWIKLFWKIIQKFHSENSKWKIMHENFWVMFEKFLTLSKCIGASSIELLLICWLIESVFIIHGQSSGVGRWMIVGILKRLLKNLVKIFK